MTSGEILFEDSSDLDIRYYLYRYLNGAQRHSFDVYLVKVFVVLTTC